MTRLIRDTMHEWADEARVPHDLADRALRRRARPGWPPVGSAVLVAAMVAAVALFVTQQGRPEPVVDPAAVVTLPARPSPAPADVRTDTKSAKPSKLVAAGGVAVSAFSESRRERIGTDLWRVRRTWHLYDPRDDGYEETSYAWVDVAPGLQVAAVLEGDLLGRRVGVLDLNTREILTWIDLEHPVASVAFSPDGTKILATAYTEYPDRLQGKSGEERSMPSTRTGYYLIDLTSGETTYFALPPLPADAEKGEPGNSNGRQDLGWGVDGSLIWAPSIGNPDRVWYDLEGREREWPEGQHYRRLTGTSSVSPDGRLMFEPKDGLPTEIWKVGSGEVAGRQQVMRLLAWADDDNAIALGCAGGCDNEFNAALVLVSVDGSKTTQLTGYDDSSKDGSWEYVLTPR